MKMKSKILILGLLALCSTLLAPRSFADTLKLKIYEADALNTALSNLDGSQRIVPQGEAPAKVVAVAYELSGKTRLTIARDIQALSPTIASIEATRLALVKQTGVTAATKQDDPLMQKFIGLLTEARSQVVEVDLVKIEEEALKLDANPIPPTVLTALLPIIKAKK